MCTDILVVKINYLYLITIFNVALLFKYYFGFKSFVVLIQELGNIGDRGLGVPGSLTPWLFHDVRVPSKAGQENLRDPGSWLPKCNFVVPRF